MWCQWDWKVILVSDMQCDAAKIWLSDAPDVDARWSDHLASCASCRAEADRAVQLRRAMQTLPQVEPAAVAGRLQQMAAATAARSLDCDEVLELLEPYREGLLNAEDSFLVEDHLLWCESCAEALEAADALATALHALPPVEAPKSIAERLAQARLPWWQRLWTAPAPSLNLPRLLQVGGTMAAVALLFAVMANLPKHEPSVAERPIQDTSPVAQSIPVTDPPPVVEQSEPTAAPKPAAVVSPAAPAQPESTPVVRKPAAAEHPDVEIMAALPIDPMVMPAAKPLIAPAIRPDAMIQPRAGVPEDGPIEVTAGRRDDPVITPPAQRPDRVVSATAREKLLEMNTEYALARSEEELSSPQLIAAAIATRPEVSRPADPALTASPEVFSKTAASYLKKDNITLTPITVESTHAPARIGIPVFTFPKKSDG